MQQTSATSHAPPTLAKKVLVATAHGMTGWALCGAVMGVAMHVTTLHRALVFHAAAAPLIFAAISSFYFRLPSPLPPLHAAIVFLATVAALDFFVVALAIEHGFTMFASILGVWIPFLLIFVSSWLTGWVCTGK